MKREQVARELMEVAKELTALGPRDDSRVRDKITNTRKLMLTRLKKTTDMVNRLVLPSGPAISETKLTRALKALKRAFDQLDAVQTSIRQSENNLY